MLDQWASVRAAALSVRGELASTPIRNALTLTEELLRRRGYEVARYPATHPLLGGAWAALFPDIEVAACDRNLTPQRQAFALAHELGHLVLHTAEGGCGAAEIDLQADLADHTAGALEIYNPRQQREREANIFALTLLLPPDLLRDLFVRQRLGAADIARRLGVSTATTLNALSGLLRTGARTANDTGSRNSLREPVLDASQRAAAQWADARVLVQAGPGTGKTGTLVGRAIHLIRDRGIDPHRLLVLTFSNRAAGELRARLTASLGAVAASVTCGTLHSFAHELLRRYSAALGLSPSFEVVDGPAVLVRLRANLADFDAMLAGLGESLPLDRPMAMLSGLLDVVGRAKDELIDAAEFAKRIAYLPDADNAARVQAAFYSWYERVIGAQHDLLDYGDLIMGAVKLLRECPGILDEVRAAYPSVLVDEYQDLNLACSTLVDLLAPGSALWAVGDARQSIYRWRGARPEALANLRVGEDTAMPALSTNYRSYPPLVRLCGGLAAALEGRPVGEGRTLWNAARASPSDPVAAVTLAVAIDETAELDGIAREMHAEIAGGRPAEDIAVLCATNAQASTISEALEARGVPVSRAGHAEDDPAVRSALALLAVASGDGDALLRLGHRLSGDVVDEPTPARTHRHKRLPPPVISGETALHIARHARTHCLSILQTLRRPPDAVPAEQRAAARRLAMFLAASPNPGPEATFGQSAWTTLARYLFDAPFAAARPLLAGEEVPSLVALDALLACARGYDRQAPGLREPTLPQHVRLLLAGGEHLQSGSHGADMPGVQVLTVHASKGLEFPVVFLPNLARGRFPARGRRGPELAAGVLDYDEARARAEDDRCLFFVAVSRACERLVLSRAEQYRGRAHEPSPLLELLRSWIEVEPPAKVVWEAGGSTGERTVVAAGRQQARESSKEPAQTGTTAQPDVDMYALESYLLCPRRFYYEHRLGLRGSPGLQFPHFHAVLRRTLARIHDTASRDAAVALSVLDEEWAQAHDPHPHEALFRERARRAVLAAVAGRGLLQGSGSSSEPHAEYRMVRRNGTVVVHFDRLDTAEGTAPVAVRYRTGRAREDHRREHRTALYHAALDEAFGGGTVRQEYLLSGTVDDGRARPATLESRLRECDDALDGINRGEFSPRPSDQCPDCPFWLICPAG